MKKIFVFLTVIMLATGLYAQSPESMSYQAVVRNASGVVLPNQTVAFRFSIINGGSIEYSETQNVTTNNLGLVSLSIGQGNVVTGSFSSLDWKNNQFELQVELDVNGGTSYVDMGTTQFLSVPYALHAKTADNVDDADADPTNEIELPATAISGQVLTYDGSSWVAQNSGSGSDNWGSQVAQVNPRLTGNGTAANPLDIASQGASNGEILKWDGFAWVPASDDNTIYTGSTGISISGSTITNTSPDQTVVLSGSGATTISGTYPNFTISSTDNVDDSDADPLNELQDISLSGTNLSISNGSTVNLSGIDTDNQTLSLSGNNLTISNGNTVVLTDNVNDADSDPTNEIELPASAVSGQVLTYDGAAWVAQNAGSGADNWGAQVAQVSSRLSGDGTSGNPIDIAQQGASTGQALKWNGSSWAPSTDDNTIYTSGTGISIAGTIITNSAPDQTVTINGGGSTSVSGTYPNFTVSSTDNVNDADSDPTNEIELPATANNGEVLMWNGTAWVAQSAGAGSGWALTGNSGTTDGTDFIGTTDDVAFNFRVNNAEAGRIGTSTDGSVFLGYQAGQNDDFSDNENTFIGYQAGQANSTGSYNTAIGNQALYSNTIGSFNVANGNYALYSNTTAGNNIAIGNNALRIQSYSNSNTSWSSYNTAIGVAALFSNQPTSISNGVRNTAVGYQTLYSNTTGYENTGTGFFALFNNSTGNSNTASGVSALQKNTTGSNNTATGSQALQDNLSGNDNTANGSLALYSNSTGSNNTAAGNYALQNNTTASNNTAIGKNALFSQSYVNSGVPWDSYNTAVGVDALYSNQPSATWNGINNTAVGYQALWANTTGSSSTATGYQALYSNTTGLNNTATGYQALYSNTTGFNNTATGYNALRYNTNGYSNTANGHYALFLNTSGCCNTANGYYAHYSNTTGTYNTATGYYALYSNTTGRDNTAIGVSAFMNNTTACNNVAIGSNALYMQSYSNAETTWSSFNTAIGVDALFSNQPTAITNGINNTAVGYQALWKNTTGYDNTANGAYALHSNTTGYSNTASGVSALQNNTTGIYNTATGYQALYSNISGYYNTASGYRTLYLNTTGDANTATGDYSLYSNTTGYQNTANGVSSLENNTIGNYNTATGYQSLCSNTTGNYNTSNGTYALNSNITGSNNAANGYCALYSNTTGHNNTALGYFAFSTGTYSNSTGIGYNAEPGASNTVRIGNASISAIGGYANWSNVSDARFKTNVQENVAGIDFIMKLRPVTYNLDMDAIAEFNGTPDSLRLFESEKLKESEIQSGFIAQEVEQAAKEVGYNFHGVDAPKNETSHYGLRYAEFVVPLVQATQEQQIIIENLNSKIDVQENEILQLTNDLEQQKRDIDALRIMIVELQSQLSTE